MKTIFTHPVQCFFIVLLLTFCQNIYSQIPIIWRGGTPGMENDWHCPQNWSTSSLPDEFSDVIIPDVSMSTFSTPQLLSGTVEVNSIRIQHNSSLSISKKATLIILEHAEGISSNKVTGEGEMIFQTEVINSQKKMFAAH